jgi:multidrug efflux pump subunit AcrA (membrane-fusion protein)
MQDIRHKHLNRKVLRSFQRLVFLPAVMASLVFLAVTQESSAQMGMMPVVNVQQAREETAPVTIKLVGSVQPYTRSVVASEVAGLVKELPVEEGDRLEAGDVICRLRNATPKFAYEQATARRKQLEAELSELEAGTRQEEIDQAKGFMEETRAMVEKWEEEFERVERLRRQGAASLKEYNDTVAEYTAAKQRFAQADAAYKLAVEGPRKEDIAQARFAVDAAKAMELQLKDNLDRTVIEAPYAGHVVQKYAEIGEWIQAGGPVVEMIDLEHVLVRIDLPESAIAAARVGQAVSVFIDAYQESYAGEIKHVIPQADEEARTFPIEIEIQNPEHKLKAGMFARVRVPSGPTAKSVVVPLDAVLQRQGTNFVVMVVPSPTGEGHMAMPVPVELGATIGSDVAVTSPMVNVGAMVCVKGHDRIFGPQPVQIRQGPAAPAEKGSTTQPAAEQPVARN